MKYRSGVPLGAITPTLPQSEDPDVQGPGTARASQSGLPRAVLIFQSPWRTIRRRTALAVQRAVSSPEKCALRRRSVLRTLDRAKRAREGPDYGCVQGREEL